MNLLDSLNAIIGQIDTALRSVPAGPDYDRLAKLRDVFDAMSDQAVHNLYDTNSADYLAAIDTLQTATSSVRDAAKDLSKVASAINTAVAAAKAVDKVVGFLSHLG